jgi:hypothetical protein
MNKIVKLFIIPMSLCLLTTFSLAAQGYSYSSCGSSKCHERYGYHKVHYKKHYRVVRSSSCCEPTCCWRYSYSCCDPCNTCNSCPVYSSSCCN